MAIFSVSVKAHSRSKGESATGGAAYRLGLNLVDEQTGVRHDFSRRKDVASAFTLLPENAPEGWSDPAVLWNEAEKAEKRKNSCVSREVLVALPHEMNDEQREELARGIAGQLVSRYGVGVSVGIHRPDDGGQNWHAHILMTTRRVGPDGMGEKTRELDDQKQGPGQVEAIREMVANVMNDDLQRHGYAVQVDHRSLADQRLAALERGDLERAAELSRAPTQHRGRNPEVAQRVAAENAATQEQNAHTQAEARAVFAQLEADAAQQARLMAPASDSPQSKQAQEAEAKEQRQEQERKAAWAVVVAAREQEREAREFAFGLDDVVENSKKQEEAATDARKAERLGAKAWGHRAAQVEASVEKWRKDHPLRAWLGWEPEQVAEAEAKAAKAREQEQEANKRKAEAEKQEREARALKEAAQGELPAAKKALAEAEAAKREATEAYEALKERQRVENLTPAQRQQEREQERQRMEQERERMLNAWHPGMLAQPQQPGQSQQRQDHTQRPQMKPRSNDWGHSL